MEPLSIVLLVLWTGTVSVGTAAWWAGVASARKLTALERYIASLEKYIYTIESRATFVGPEEEHRKDLRKRFRSE